MVKEENQIRKEWVKCLGKGRKMHEYVEEEKKQIYLKVKQKQKGSHSSLHTQRADKLQKYLENVKM